MRARDGWRYRLVAVRRQGAGGRAFFARTSAALPAPPIKTEADPPEAVLRMATLRAVRGARRR